MNTTSTTFIPSPGLIRRPSPSSRPSFAASIVDQGESAAADAPAETAHIEEEIAEIKRYEVSCDSATAATMCVCVCVAMTDSDPGLYHHRYAIKRTILESTKR
jgi:hypothetical protein